MCSKQKEMDAKPNVENSTWAGPKYSSLAEACSYNVASGQYVCLQEVEVAGIQDGTRAEALRLSAALRDHVPAVAAYLERIGGEGKCNYYTMVALTAASGKAFVPSVCYAWPAAEVGQTTSDSQIRATVRQVLEEANQKRKLIYHS